MLVDSWGYVGNYLTLQEFVEDQGLQTEYENFKKNNELVIGDSCFQGFLEALKSTYILIEPTHPRTDNFTVLVKLPRNKEYIERKQREKSIEKDAKKFVDWNSSEAAVLLLDKPKTSIKLKFFEGSVNSTEMEEEINKWCQENNAIPVKIQISTMNDYNYSGQFLNYWGVYTLFYL